MSHSSKLCIQFNVHEGKWRLGLSLEYLFKVKQLPYDPIRANSLSSLMFSSLLVLNLAPTADPMSPYKAFPFYFLFAMNNSADLPHAAPRPSRIPAAIQNVSTPGHSHKRFQRAVTTRSSIEQVCRKLDTESHSPNHMRHMNATSHNPALHREQYLRLPRMDSIQSRGAVP